MKNILVILLCCTFASGACFANQKTRTQFQYVVDEVKGKIYAQYRKALAENPRAKGDINLDLYINEKGNLVQCKVVYSQLNNDKLEKSICRILKEKSYSNISILPTNISYDFSFVPAM